MDLFSLSYLVQHGRYHVPAELVAEAMLRMLRPELAWAREAPDRRTAPDHPERALVAPLTPTGRAPGPRANAAP